MAESSPPKGLPKWAWGIIAVVGTGAILVTGYTIYKGVQARIKEAGSLQENRDISSELNAFIKRGIKPSFANSQYSGWANELFAAMDGYGYSFTVIIRIIGGLKNDADILKLEEAYGIQELSSGKFNPEPNFRGTLSASLSYKLFTSDLQILNALLAKHGISIKF